MMRRLFCFAFGLFLAGPLCAVAQKAPKFNVVSVKPVPVDGQGLPQLRPHRILNTQRVDLLGYMREIIGWAYDMPLNEIQYPPSYKKLLDSFYDIIGQPAGPATEDQLRAMMRELLAERFKLAVRTEQHMVPGYSLVVAKGGPINLRPMAPFDPNHPGAGRHGITISQFARYLYVGEHGYLLSPGMTGVMPVVDETGIKGTYDLSPGAPPFGNAWLSRASAPFLQPKGVTPISMASLLKEKIGLTLVKGKVVSQASIMVTHIEPPTPN